MRQISPPSSERSAASALRCWHKVPQTTCPSHRSTRVLASAELWMDTTASASPAARQPAFDQSASCFARGPRMGMDLWSETAMASRAVGSSSRMRKPACWGRNLSAAWVDDRPSQGTC